MNATQPLYICTEETQQSPCISAEREHNTAPVYLQRGSQDSPCISAQRKYNTAPVYLQRWNTTQPLYICREGTQDSPWIPALEGTQDSPWISTPEGTQDRPWIPTPQGVYESPWKAIYLSYPYFFSQVVMPGTTMALIKRKNEMH